MVKNLFNLMKTISSQMLKISKMTHKKHDEKYNIIIKLLKNGD